MAKLKQTPDDRVLWTLASMNGKAEWTELRIRTKMIAAELDVVLSELVKDGRISISPSEMLGTNWALSCSSRDEKRDSGRLKVLEDTPRTSSQWRLEISLISRNP